MKTRIFARNYAIQSFTIGTLLLHRYVDCIAYLQHRKFSAVKVLNELTIKLDISMVFEAQREFYLAINIFSLYRPT